MYKLGPAYEWDNWADVPIGTRCVNLEFPGSVFVLVRPGVLAWDGNGQFPKSNRHMGAESNPLGFTASARWTRPLLWPDTVLLPVGA